MIIRKKSIHENLSRFRNMKMMLIASMVATFMIFALGSATTISGGEISSILVGASLFALASAMLIKAGEISKKLYR